MVRPSIGTVQNSLSKLQPRFVLKNSIGCRLEPILDRKTTSTNIIFDECFQNSTHYFNTTNLQPLISESSDEMKVFFRQESCLGWQSNHRWHHCWFRLLLFEICFFVNHLFQNFRNSRSRNIRSFIPGSLFEMLNSNLCKF